MVILQHLSNVLYVIAFALNSLPPHIHTQAQLNEQLAGLQTLTAARRSKLEESIKLHQYLQDVEEVLSWLADKEGVASSDDYGKDYEHLLVSYLLLLASTQKLAPLPHRN